MTSSSAATSDVHCSLDPMIVTMRVVILPFIMTPCVFCVWSHHRRTLTQRTVIWTPLPAHHTTDKQPSSPPAETEPIHFGEFPLFLLWV